MRNLQSPGNTVLGKKITGAQFQQQNNNNISIFK